MDKGTYAEKLLEVVSNTQIPEEAKSKLKAIVEAKSWWFDELLSWRSYAAPEVLEGKLGDRIWHCTCRFFYFVEPILEEYNVDKPVGRDLSRDIYKAFGGISDVKYETK